MLYRPSVVRKRPDGSRRREKTAVWWGRFIDPTSGRKVSVSMQTADKAAARIAFARIERDAQTGAANKHAEYHRRALTEHVGDWLDVLEARGKTPKQVGTLRFRVTEILTGCGFNRWPDLSRSKVEIFIGKLRKRDGTKVQGKPRYRYCARTRNGYARAIHQFCRWCVTEDRAASNPMKGLHNESEAADPRHARRAFQPDELGALLAATRSGGDVFGMGAESRYWLYRLACETGVRANELRTLRWSQVKTNGKVPGVTVRAKYAKNRKTRTIPLRKETAAELVAWRGRSGPVIRMDGDVSVFASIPERSNVVRMLRVDLAVAGVLYKNADGEHADFHAMRHTFGTNLARAGVVLKDLQALMDHASPTTTARYYSHVTEAELAAAIGKMTMPETTRPESATDAA